eukprot:CAMPEP_0198221080 /NCGR_PEP_ID=MMETSP1445-20131203/82085_1 /TAXON_ID=36898 /ORGANISM="Pyramimonas sp., Strain CCMP2087" /LENGTH=63 /DNA_ID=CAMNT_0043899077 /DNA_START=409 /DNA_END=600 /DNA_ORIENTATION=-
MAGAVRGAAEDGRLRGRQLELGDEPGREAWATPGFHPGGEEGLLQPLHYVVLFALHFEPVDGD